MNSKPSALNLHIDIISGGDLRTYTDARRA